jgi:hypothetical protein
VYLPENFLNAGFIALTTDVITVEHTSKIKIAVVIVINNGGKIQYPHYSLNYFFGGFYHNLTTLIAHIT